MSESAITEETREPTREPSRLRIIAEGLAIASILIIALSFAISFIWEWGYWNTFGLSLAEIPISVEDLASSVLDWVPALFLAATVYMSSVFIRNVSLDINKLDELPNKEEVLAMRNAYRATGNEKEASRLSQYHYTMVSSWIFLIACPILIILVQVILGKIVVILMCISIAWLGYMLIPFIARKFSRDHEDIVAKILGGLVFLLYIYTVSRISASNDVEDNPTKADISVITDRGVQNEEIIVLRSNNDFIFAYDETTKKLIITPWRSVVSLNFNSVPNYGVYDIPFIPPLITEDGESEE